MKQQKFGFAFWRPLRKFSFFACPLPFPPQEEGCCKLTNQQTFAFNSTDLRCSSWACKNTAFDSECNLKVFSWTHVAKQLLYCNVSCFSFTKSDIQIFFCQVLQRIIKKSLQYFLIPNGTRTCWVHYESQLILGFATGSAKHFLLVWGIFFDNKNEL